MKYFIIFYFSILIYSCTFNVNNFTAKPHKKVQKMPLSPIKLNGMYFQIADSISQRKVFGIYYFYENGVVLKYVTYIVDDFKNITKEMLIDSVFKCINDENKYWPNRKHAGGYKIINKNIEVQIFLHLRGGGFKNTTFKGAILNDTTIYINNCTVKKDNDLCRNSNFYLHFLSMAKPDSAHQWMKRNWYWTK